jgi:histidinol-phosphatase
VTSGPGTLAQAVEEVARLAGRAAVRYFRGRIAVETKADGSPVTIADREAERVAREWIEARFPSDGILGEEFGAVRSEARRRWLLDPVDGTASFIRGVPLWGTLVAVAEGDEVLAGAAYFPPVDEIVVAGLGEGCWWNGSRCAVSSVADLAEATVLTTDDQFRRQPERGEGWRRLAARARRSRTWGDCFGYFLVATGRAEVMVDATLSPWDSAVLLPIIEEAGGVFTDWSGTRTAFGGSAVATNRALAAEVRAILRGTGNGERGTELGPLRRSDSERG